MCSLKWVHKLSFIIAFVFSFTETYSQARFGLNIEVGPGTMLHNGDSTNNYVHVYLVNLTESPVLILQGAIVDSFDVVLYTVIQEVKRPNKADTTSSLDYDINPIFDADGNIIFDDTIAPFATKYFFSMPFNKKRISKRKAYSIECLLEFMREGKAVMRVHSNRVLYKNNSVISDNI